MAELRALVARAEAREEETRAAEGEKLTLRVRDKSNGYVPLRLPMYPVAEPGEVRSVIGALPRLHTISSPRSGVGRAELVAAPGCERRLFTAPCCEQVGGLTDEEPGGVSEAEREGRLCAPAPAEESQLSETVCCRSIRCQLALIPRRRTSSSGSSRPLAGPSPCRGC